MLWLTKRKGGEKMDNADKPKIGRPTVDEDDALSHRVFFRINKSTCERIDSMARQSQRTRSAMIRLIIEEFINTLDMV